MTHVARAAALRRRNTGKARQHINAREEPTCIAMAVADRVQQPEHTRPLVARPSPKWARKVLPAGMPPSPHPCTSPRSSIQPSSRPSPPRSSGCVGPPPSRCSPPLATERRVAAPPGPAEPPPPRSQLHLRCRDGRPHPAPPSKVICRQPGWSRTTAA